MAAVPKIPLVDVKAQYAPLADELRERLDAVLDSSTFIRGPNVQAFEEEAAAYLGVKRTVGVANGTDALVLVLDAMGIGPGDEVICPAFTFYATAESIARRGATPVFADIDPATLNLDSEDTAARITDRTRAIMPVHLFGRPAPVVELAELGLPLIEDAAQAFGSPGIASSAVSTFSFYPTKNLFCLGDGGLVAANDEDLAERIRMLAFHGSRDKTDFQFVGYNSRLDELQAAFLRVFLTHLDEWTRARREAAARYAELGLGELVQLPEDEPGHVYHLFVCRSPERDRIRAALSAADIASAVYYTTPLHLQQALRFLGWDSGSLPETERAAQENFSLPLWPGIPAGRAGAGSRDGAFRRGCRRPLIPVNRHRLWQVAADALLIAAAWFLAFQLRFDFNVPPTFADALLATTVLVVAIKLAVFVAFGFYNRWWRYVSTKDMWRAALGVLVASALAALAVYFGDPFERRLPRGVVIIDFILLLGLVAGTRLAARTIFERPAASGLVARGKEVIVVGAGDAGQLVIREMQRSRQLGYTPIGIVDDDPRKKNLRVHGVRVLGTTEALPHILRDNKPDELLIAIPSASGEDRQKVVEIARRAGVPVKTLPGLYELISDDDNLAGRIRPVQVEDVLGREPVEVDVAAISEYLAGETVLVTGAGGSIGSELCRQIARAGPARLVLVDQGETALFEIERELVDEREFTASIPVLADVSDRTRIRSVFERYRPGVVFHAAAYKHVPLMEANPLESVRNNVLATRVIADTAVEFEAKRFVLISTDKALNPRAVYGQCKALCEWIVEAYGSRDDVPTRFVAVRFGNVLGSAGSVITIFKRQIEQGGPVTITHPEMTRYFMTTPEAVSLVVQAGAIGGGGEIFVLDMGEPVGILDLARDMIRLSGKEPERDIPIDFIGVRAGEKLHEQLWGADEEVADTGHPKISRARRVPVDASLAG